MKGFLVCNDDFVFAPLICSQVRLQMQQDTQPKHTYTHIASMQLIGQLIGMWSRVFGRCVELKGSTDPLEHPGTATVIRAFVLIVL